MNQRIRELMIESGIYECDDFEPHPTFEKFAELIEQDCIDKFIKVWYKQGLDIRGAELGKFMLCYEELNDERRIENSNEKSLDND